MITRDEMYDKMINCLKTVFDGVADLRKTPTLIAHPDRLECLFCDSTYINVLNSGLIDCSDNFKPLLL